MATSPGRSLSKDAMYAPLLVATSIGSYQHDDLSEVKEKKSKRRRRSTESDDKKAIIEFFQDVSRTYSGCESGTLRSSVIESKLFQRSLTLVGGGINNDFSNNKKSKMKNHVKFQKKLRSKKMIGKGVRKFSKLGQDVKEKLDPLINLWNSYIVTLIEGCTNENEVAKVIRTQAELIGAVASIERCVYCSSMVGLQGVIVESTANVWRLVQTNRNSKGKVLLVPKKDTILLLQAELPQTLVAKILRAKSDYYKSDEKEKIRVAIIMQEN